MLLEEDQLKKVKKNVLVFCKLLRKIFSPVSQGTNNAGETKEIEGMLSE